MRGVADDRLAMLIVRLRQLEPNLTAKLIRDRTIQSRSCYSVQFALQGVPQMQTPPARRVEAIAFMDGLVTGAECVKFEADRSGGFRW